jgi:hypothetical protein
MLNIHKSKASPLHKKNKMRTPKMTRRKFKTLKLKKTKKIPQSSQNEL